MTPWMILFLRTSALIVLAVFAIGEAWRFGVLSRLLVLVPAVVGLLGVVVWIENKPRLRPALGFVWLGVCTLFLLGVSVGESASTLTPVFFLVAIVSTARTPSSGAFAGALAGGGVIFLSAYAGLDLPRAALGGLPVLFVAVGLLAGSISRTGEQAWEQVEDLREELAEQAERINNVLACVASGVLVVDEDTRIITYNRAAERILGVLEHKALGRKLQDADQLSQLGEALAPPSTASDSTLPRDDLEFERPDGNTIYVGYAVSTLENLAGRRLGLILVFQDVTLIRDYADRMLRQEQLAALGRMVSGIAHEFGNILGGARGLLDMAADEEPAEAVQSLPVVRETLTRALATVENLLRFARGTPLNRIPGVELSEVLQHALTLLRADLEKHGVEVETVFDEVPPLSADAVQLEQVFINFIINGMHAVDDRESGQLRISLREQDDRTQVRFEDNGPGVDAELRDRIFEPFFTTKGSFGGSKVPGTGLGLSVALGVIEGHQGTVKVDASPDLGGACFTVSFPSTNGDGSSTS